MDPPLWQLLPDHLLLQGACVPGAALLRGAALVLGVPPLHSLTSEAPLWSWASQNGFLDNWLTRRCPLSPWSPGLVMCPAASSWGCREGKRRVPAPARLWAQEGQGSSVASCWCGQQQRASVAWGSWGTWSPAGRSLSGVPGLGSCPEQCGRALSPAGAGVALCPQVFSRRESQPGGPVGLSLPGYGQALRLRPELGLPWAGQGYPHGTPESGGSATEGPPSLGRRPSCQKQEWRQGWG